MVAPGSVSISDLMHNLGLAGSPSPDLNLAITQGQGIVTTTKQAALGAQTLSASGNSTAPGAGSAICTLTTPPAGYYQVQVIVGFGATAESTAVDNFKFENSGSVVATCPVTNAANTQSTYTYYVTVTSGNLTVNANVVASASSVYKATINATRIA